MTIVKKFETLSLLERSRPLQACNCIVYVIYQERLASSKLSYTPVRTLACAPIILNQEFSDFNDFLTIFKYTLFMGDSRFNPALNLYVSLI